VCGWLPPGSNRGVLFLKLANLPPNFRPEKKKRKGDFDLFKGFLMEKNGPDIVFFPLLSYIVYSKIWRKYFLDYRHFIYITKSFF
jgi:hypothetical protein